MGTHSVDGKVSKGGLDDCPDPPFDVLMGIYNMDGRILSTVTSSSEHGADLEAWHSKQDTVNEEQRNVER